MCEPRAWVDTPNLKDVRARIAERNRVLGGYPREPGEVQQPAYATQPSEREPVYAGRR